jgi:predicted outer membrane protein
MNTTFDWMGKWLAAPVAAAAWCLVTAGVAVGQHTNDPSLLGGVIGPQVTGVTGPGMITVQVPFAAPVIGTSSARTNDQLAATWLAAANTAQVRLGRMAEAFTSSEQVRELARQVVLDHGKLADDLRKYGGPPPVPRMEPGGAAVPGEAGPPAISAQNPTWTPPDAAAIEDRIHSDGLLRATVNRASREAIFSGRASDAVQGQNRNVPSGVAWVDRSLPNAALGSAGGPAGSSVGASTLFHASQTAILGGAMESMTSGDLDAAVQHAHHTMISATSESFHLRDQLMLASEGRLSVPGSPTVRLQPVPVWVDENGTATGNPPNGGISPLDPLVLRDLVSKQELALVQQDLAGRHGTDFDRAYLVRQLIAERHFLATLQVMRNYVSPALGQLLDQSIQTTGERVNQIQTALGEIEGGTAGNRRGTLR